MTFSRRRDRFRYWLGSLLLIWGGQLRARAYYGNIRPTRHNAARDRHAAGGPQDRGR